MVLVCAALLPVLLFGVVLAALFARGERLETERGLRSAARALSVALHREFETHIRSLQILATADELDRRDLRRFHTLAARAVEASPAWEAVMLVDPGGEQLVSTRVPYGSPLPRTGIPEVIARTIADRRPAVSDLFPSSLTRRPVIALTVPVVRGEGVRYVLTSTTSPERIQALLGSERVPAGGLAAVVDRSGVIVARTLGAERFVGRPGDPMFAGRDAGAAETVWRGATPEGVEVQAALHRSPVSGWTVAVAAPAAAVDAPVRRAIALVSAAGLALLLGGAWLAIRVGRRIAAPIAGLAEAAVAVGRGAALERPRSSVLEVERVARALEDASSERGRAEASLRRNEAFYRSLLENALDMVTVVDAAGVVVYESPAITRVLGWTPDERIGRSSVAVVHPDDLPGVVERIAQGFLAPGTPQALAFRARHRDGTWRHIDSVGHVFVDEAGAAIGVINSRDVTAQRRAEEELTLQASALDAAANGIAITDREGRIVWVNRAFMRLTGYPAAEIIGQTPRLLKSGRHDQAFYKGLWETVLAGEPWRGEMVNRRRDGTLYTEEQIVTPVRATGGGITHFIAVKQDVTERKRLDEELRQQREALYQSEKLAGMGQLLAGVAHELNNPLTVVIARTAMLGNVLAGGPHESTVKKLADAAERCARIVKNFVALARQRPPTRQEVRLNQVVLEAVELVSYSLHLDDVEVALDLAPDLPPIWGDPHQLHQVVVNLVTNAHHAMRDTAPPRRLVMTTRADAAHGRIRLEVADTGPGIPAAMRARVFEPFFTTKPLGQGTGLGLSICQGIVEGHDGTITVASGGPGATFVVELPAGGPAPPATEPRAAAGPALTRRGRILVVDDEVEVGHVLAELLAADGHEVETASDGLDALDRLGRRAYDLVLSDIKMPNLDGRGLYREVERRLPELAGRVIFLTGDALSPEVAEFIGASGRPSLDKPFDPEQVRRIVSQALGPA